MSDRRPARRKRTLINRRLQFHLTGAFLAGVLATLVLFSAVGLGVALGLTQVGDGAFGEFYVPYRMVEKDRPAPAGLGAGTETYTTTSVGAPVRRWEIVAPWLIANNLLLLVVLAGVGLKVSHRVAGPVWNINRSLDLAAQGLLDREIRLRKKDYFHDTAEKLNRILRSQHLINRFAPPDPLASAGTDPLPKETP